MVLWALALGAAAPVVRAEPTVLLVTFDGVDRGALTHPGGEGWFVGDAVPGSNRPARALFGLLSGISPAFLEGTVPELARHVLLGHRLAALAGESDLWVSTRDRDRVRMLRALAPSLMRYRRLRSAVRDLEELRAESGFLWVDVAEPMAARANNTVQRLARALGQRPVMVVATTVKPDESGLVPLWIRMPGESGSLGTSSTTLVSLESVGTAMQSFLGLAPSPLAAGPWPRPTVMLGERWQTSGTLELSARRGAAEVRVEWQPGGLASCWLRTAAGETCRWSRGPRDDDAPEFGTETTASSSGAVDAAEQDYRDLENHLLWILERRLE